MKQVFKSSCMFVALALLLGLTVTANATASSNLTLADQVNAGRELFSGTCSKCHQANGGGLQDVIPPLSGSDFLNSNPRRSIGILLRGLHGNVKVNGKDFDSTMPSMKLFNNDEIANVLTYVLNSWGNKGGRIDSSEVKAERDKLTATVPAGH